MRVVGRHEHAVAADRDAAIHAAGGDTDQAPRAWTPVVPDLAAAARIERVEIIRRRDIHHAADDDRRHLQLGGVGKRKHPLRREAAHIVGGDAREGTVPVPARLSVIGRPLGLRGHLAVPPAGGLAEQVHGAVVAEELQLAVALVEHDALEGPATGDCHVARRGPALERGRSVRRNARGQSPSARESSETPASPTPGTPSRITASRS